MIVAALAVERRRVDLAGEQEDGDGVGPAFGDPGQGVGRAGAGGCAHDAGPARDARVPVRGEGAGLLVADQDRANRARPSDRVVDRRRVRARHPEKMTHPPPGQALDQQIDPASDPALALIHAAHYARAAPLAEPSTQPEGAQKNPCGLTL